MIDKDATLISEANSTRIAQEFERMARRRFQKPTPKVRGGWWVAQIREYVAGSTTRSNRRLKIAPADWPYRKVLKELDTYMSKINQGVEAGLPGAQTFEQYLKTYRERHLTLLADSTQNRYDGIIRNYLSPTFGKLALRDMTLFPIQGYFSGFVGSKLSHESIDKIRDVLSAILETARGYGFVSQNGAENVKLPPARYGKRRNKAYVTPEQFVELVSHISEPYATMVYVAIYTGLRVSELVGLKWNDIGESSITIDERYCRGHWGVPKSESSNATIGVNHSVIERILRLKSMTVTINWGGQGAKKELKAVKDDSPEALVFQSVKTGSVMRDNNILSRHIKPAGRKLGMAWLNWRCLRTSHATWLKLAGADIKDAQAQLRHSRASTTLDIYQQFVPESQQKAVDKLSMLTRRVQ